ncbi:hypothetical protein ACFOPN_17035 [Xanthomonas hyacinthi]|uniref:hypothetical protein n=1 Tax=Xanthomonas hyacinthi TaxID=56455 RepID=UPI00360A9A39
MLLIMLTPCGHEVQSWNAAVAAVMAVPTRQPDAGSVDAEFVSRISALYRH